MYSGHDGAWPPRHVGLRFMHKKFAVKRRRAWAEPNALRVTSGISMVKIRLFCAAEPFFPAQSGKKRVLLSVGFDVARDDSQFDGLQLSEPLSTDRTLPGAGGTRDDTQFDGLQLVGTHKGRISEATAYCAWAALERSWIAMIRY
jgi:hypothetical protein